MNSYSFWKDTCSYNDVKHYHFPGAFNIVMKKYYIVVHVSTLPYIFLLILMKRTNVGVINQGTFWQKTVKKLVLLWLFLHVLRDGYLAIIYYIHCKKENEWRGHNLFQVDAICSSISRAYFCKRHVADTSKKLFNMTTILNKYLLGEDQLLRGNDF